MDRITTYKIFLVKTFKEKRYFWSRNLFFVAFPLLFFSIFIFSGVANDKTPGGIYSNETRPFVQRIDEDDLFGSIPSALHDKFYFAPNTTFFADLMERFRQKVEIQDERVVGFADETEMLAIGSLGSHSFIIIFDSNVEKNQLRYTIRSKSNSFQTDRQFSKDLLGISSKSSNEYIENGFLGIQHALDQVFFEMKSNSPSNSLPYAIQLERILPAPHIPIASKIHNIGVYIIIFASIICISLIFTRMVEEKSCGFREQLKNATPFSYMNNVALFSVNHLQMLLIFYICIIMASMDGIWFSVNVFYPAVLVFVFITSIISFTFLVSSFFESIAFATVGAIFWYFVPFFCYHLATVQWKKILIIFPVNSFYQGISILHDYTNSGHYYCHPNFFQTSHPNDGVFSMFDVFMWLITSGIVCGFLYFYISNVWPGTYGISQGPFFIFQRSYYVPNRVDARSEVEQLSFNENGFENFQHLHQNALVRIRNLTKTFKTINDTQTAVKNLSMDIYKNQITVLLGHNGAGKTTTMCMLTGLIQKTSGNVFVDNNDNIKFYRAMIGYCPQHNISLPYLTCREHLIFFGQLRGLLRFNAEVEADDILKKVNLQSKADEVAKRLSGGMLRKLCLGNAIIGQTKLLILDEPSSGLDPESRRDIWNILLKLKKNHTILITTHFMEEADVLGDKIAIMENGELIAYGTSMFLKHYFGTGYTLKMLKCNDTEKFDRTSVHNTIKRHIPSAEPKSSVEPLYCMTLPYKDKDKYGNMLQELECNKAAFGIDALSITNTTLEEVFLNTASSKINNSPKDSDEDEADGTHYTALPIYDPKNINLKQIFFRQFQAIFYKKFIYWIRNLPFFCAMVAIPIILTWLCFVLNNYLSDITHMSLNLKMKDISNPIMMINFKNYNNEKIQSLFEDFGRDQGADVRITRSENIERDILELAESDLLKYYDHLIGAIEIELNQFDDMRLNIKIYFSQNILHSVGILVNFVDNVMLKYQHLKSYNIEVINSPLNRKDENINYIQNLYTEFVPIGLMLYMIMFLPFTFKEKISGFKNLQNIPPLIYWGALFLSDLIVHATVCLIITLITSYDREGLSFQTTELETIAIMFFIYGTANLVVIYVTSQCFSSLSSCITFLNYLQIFSLFGVIIMSNNKESMREYSSLISIFHILPDFALKHSLKVIHEHHNFEGNHAKVGNSKESTIYMESLMTYQDIFDLGQFYVANLLIFIIASLFLFLFVENQQLMEQFGYFCSRVQMCWCMVKNDKKSVESIQLNDLEDDPDVNHEKSNVEDLMREEKCNEEAMVVSNLKKVYGGEFWAVNDISFTVKNGECFGLLGMNGAGKTTTFEMTTLNRAKTNGKIFVNGVDADLNRFLYRHQFGYCPQQDALCDYMTAAEMLRYMLMINGCNRYDLNEQISLWLRKVDIENYRDTKISRFSGGTKRKLNTAMAMVADPYIVFLDEPTTGVDPKSRRFVWKCIKSLQLKKKTIVLSSHSMDECEMLCNRLAIMRYGEIKCIGYIQRLKEKYGKGFSLMIKTKPKVIDRMGVSYMEGPRTETDSCDSAVPAVETITDIKLRMQAMFESCDLKDEHEGVLQYFIHTKGISWGQVFQDLLDFSTEYENVIDSFAINETTLEDIFQQFRNEQMTQ